MLGPALPPAKRDQLVTGRRHEKFLLLLLLSLTLLIAGYWVTRYAGLIMEGDATRLTQAGEGIANEGRLVTAQSYLNGYGYPALLAFLIQTTGLTAQVLQIAGSFWLVPLALAAYLAYRELLPDIRLAILAVILLLLHPDFLFYILRSSHERTTWTFGLLILWLWVRSNRSQEVELRLAMVLSLYLLLWAVIANNAYFGSTIVTTFLLAMLANYVLARFFRRASRGGTPMGFHNRMLYVWLSGFALLFLFITYVYSPATSYYYTLGTIGEKVSVLFLGSEPISQRMAVDDTYGYVQTAWLSPTVYLLLTGFQWLIVVLAIGAWLRDGVALLRRGHTVLSQQRLLLWLFFLGFATQVGLGVISDLSGAMGSNLQVRLFTPFALVVSPMAATWFTALRRIPWRRLNALRPALMPLGAMVACVAVIATLLKVTNDPVVGNQWLFYSPGEQVALDWTDDHLKDREIWIDTWQHQFDVLLFRRGYDWKPRNNYRSGSLAEWRSDEVSHVLLSDLTVLQANRSKLPLPMVVDRDIVYDNGDAQLFHRRQRSPFQK